MANTEPVKPKGGPWFSTAGAPGDRTLDQQLMGLERLFAEVAGKMVLDVGCAEGLISIECALQGASVFGVEIREPAVKVAERTAKTLKLHWSQATFAWADAQDFTPSNDYDIVLLLAVLHKLRDPSVACRRLAAAAKDLVVIRLPPDYAPDIVDARSGGTVHRIHDVMVDCGFALEHADYSGPFGEHVAYYRRVST